MSFVHYLGFTKVCLLKEFHSSGFQYILYIIYVFFQHLESNLQLMIPITSLHGKVVYSFS